MRRGLTMVAVGLMVLVVILTFVYRSGLHGLEGQSGSDRSGNNILIGVSLFARWVCMAVVLTMVASRGGFGWPASKGGQVALVLTLHTVLGVVSFVSAVSKTMHTDLSPGTLRAMGWVPVLLPALEIVAVLTILYPWTFPRQLRTGALSLLAAVGLAAFVVLTAMIVREERQNRTARGASSTSSGTASSPDSN